jgi:hypothetical protein
VNKDWWGVNGKNFYENVAKKKLEREQKARDAKKGTAIYET